MTPRLHYRLLFWNLLLIGLTVGVLDYILNNSLRGYLEYQIEQQLWRESVLASAYLERSSVQEGVDPVADHLSKMLNVRVTVIGGDGRVLGDSELGGASLASVENHAGRPEFRQAIGSGMGKALRYSATLHTHYMYVARKSDRGVVRLAMPLTEVDRVVGEMRSRLLYASLVAVALTCLFSYLVALKISRPIRAVAEGARRLAAGDLDQRLAINGHDEIAALAYALNSMAENLSSKIHELSEGKKNLERTLRMRKDFVANVSHEFKTPLTAIRGYTETLLSGAEENPAVRGEFLRVIERNARHLESLVQDLLTLAKLEAELPATREQVRLRDLLNEQLSARQTAIRDRGIRVMVDCPGLIVQADRSRLTTAISNLIDNAISYNRPGGEIRISASSGNGGSLALDIEDTGYGIPEEEIPRIFERFYRVDKARSRDSGGTGLGLAIAKHAIESQGGQITVESALDRGSKFTIRLTPL